MYRHLLVPVDDSEVSADTVTRAVEFAQHVDAQITFFHARPNSSGTAEDAPQHSISADTVAEEAAGPARALLAKAQAAARQRNVPSETLIRTSDRPYEAILAAAEEAACDVIVMASHGRPGLGRTALGSQTHEVLLHAKIPVLVTSVARNDPASAQCDAIAAIKDEHRSLVALIHALKEIVRDARRGDSPPDFELLSSMLRYVVDFPEKSHHPKESGVLFALLRERTREADGVIATLEAQHGESGKLTAELERALARYQAGTSGGYYDFAHAVERFADAQLQHMDLEEEIVLPAAGKYLTPSDWAEVASAFRANGQPSVGDAGGHDLARLFARIMNLAPAAAG